MNSVMMMIALPALALSAFMVGWNSAYIRMHRRADAIDLPLDYYAKLFLDN